jgi:hypothetical protein
MADVRSMCAIGKRGQLGLNGVLPWQGNWRANIAGVARFFEMTRDTSSAGAHCRLSPFAYDDRMIVTIRPPTIRPRLSPAFRTAHPAGGVPRRLGGLRPLHPPLGHHAPAL